MLLQQIRVAKRYAKKKFSHIYTMNSLEMWPTFRLQNRNGAYSQ